MTFDLEKILQSKRAVRQKLAARPLTEKLEMLDVLRESALALRAAQTSSGQPGDSKNSSASTENNF